MTAVAPVSIMLASVLAEHAHAIRELGKRTREDIAEIGRHLVETRNLIERGAWLVWLEAEFGWSDQTAYRFIHVYELSRDARFHTCVELDLPLGVLYRLAAPKAEEARQEIAEQIEAGEQVTAEMVIQAVTGRRKTPPQSDPAESTKIENVDVAEDDAPASAAKRKAEYAATEGDDDNLGASNVIAFIPTAPATKTTPPSAKSKPKNSAICWQEATPEDQQLIRDLILEEFFAQASGVEIYDHIPTTSRTEIVAAFLDRLTVDGLCQAMSDDFRRALGGRMPTSKVKGKKKTLTLTANPAQPRENRLR
jgi:hypothetical protein